jgi:hypothetical protein
MINQLIEIKAVKKYLIWLKYADGVEGSVDLSHLAHQGVFNIWDEGDTFFNLKIDKETGAISWENEIELCPVSLYQRIKGYYPPTINEPEEPYASN